MTPAGPACFHCSEPVPPGIVVHARIGDRVEKRQPLATLLVGARAIDQPQMVERIRDAFLIGPDAVAPPRLILGTVDEV